MACAAYPPFLFSFRSNDVLYPHEAARKMLATSFIQARVRTKLKESASRIVRTEQGSDGEPICFLREPTSVIPPDDNDPVVTMGMRF
jgi:hypothetical protein